MNNPCKLLLYKFSADECAIVARRAEYHEIVVDIARDAKDLRAKASGCDAVMLREFSAGARAAVARLRTSRGGLPVLVVVADEAITPKMLEHGNRAQIEILPRSTPSGRRWRHLREICESHRSGRRNKVANQRAHYRVPFHVKALLTTEVETCDVSLGGISFFSTRRYEIGDSGRISISAMLGDLEDGQDAGFAFRVASVQAEKNGPYRFRIGAKFHDLSADNRESLKTALELLEPTGEELP